MITRWTLALVSLLLSACAAHRIGVPEPIHGGDPVAAEAETLRKAQFRSLHEFDNTLMTAGDLCATLCEHHTSICGLSTRICAIAKVHPESTRTAELCEQSNETCRETSLRLPQDCFCRSAGQ